MPASDDQPSALRARELIRVIRLAPTVIISSSLYSRLSTRLRQGMDTRTGGVDVPNSIAPLDRHQRSPATSFSRLTAASFPVNGHTEWLKGVEKPLSLEVRRLG